MREFLQDVRFGWRVLLKSRGFMVVTVLTLGLGIGASTLIFSVVDAVLLKPLPFKDRDRLVMVWERNPQGKKNVTGPANFVRWREQNKVFDQMASVIYLDWMTTANISVNSEPERVAISYVSPELFPMLGVNASLGRTFVKGEGGKNSPETVLLGHGIWKRRFGGDPNVIGKVIPVNGKPTEIVGVLPEDYAFPRGAEIFEPVTYDASAIERRGRYMMVLAHLAPGVTLAQAQSEMSLIAHRLEVETPKLDAGWGAQVVPLRDDLVGEVRKAILVLFGAVGFLLLIACANVANLLLARATSRDKEVSTRMALGAPNSRLVRQFLTESLLLSALGGVLGVVIAQSGLLLVLRILPIDLPTFTPVGLNMTVLLYALGISIVTGVVFGMAPVMRAWKIQPIEALKTGLRAGLEGPRRHRTQNFLVVGEAALAMVLLFGAGLLMKSFVRLMTVDAGFESANVLTMSLSLPSTKYGKQPQQNAFFNAALEKLRAIPGVKSVGAISFLPLGGIGSATDFTVDDRPKPAAGEEPVADVRSVAGDYFKALGIPLLRGRLFDESQDRTDDDIKKVVINQTAANLWWPGQDPIGKRVTMPWGKDLHAEVIGVVKDVKMVGLEETSRTTLYWFMPQFQLDFMTFVMKTDGIPKSLAGSVKAQIASVDPELPVANMQSMDEVVANAVKQPRFTTALLASFAGLALLLAGIGIYGVISYSVAQRTREMGIRMALGAQTADVMGMVISQGMRMAALGVAIGIAGAFAIGGLISSLLFGVKATDLSTFATVAALLAAVALLATYIPARRATKVEPMVALRYE